MKVSLGALTLAGIAEAKLVQVHALVRHGNRAPNAELVDSCPKLFPSLKDIVDKFGVRPQALTRMGLNQCFVVGKMIRSQYLGKDKFLPEDYESAAIEYKFMARGGDRHQQSMAALGQALFPPGTGFSTYPFRQQALPMWSQMTKDDPVLHPPKPCQARRYRDDYLWSQTKGKTVIAEKADEVKTISDICGFDIAQAAVPSGVLKDIADGFGFMLYEGLNMDIPDWVGTSSMIVNLSYEMFVERLFGTEQQATYWAGDYPRYVVSQMLNMVNRKLDNRGNPSPKMNIYTVSRELVFATEYFFGLKLDIPAPDTPRGAMPPGNALVFELHQDDPHDREEFYVQAWDMFPSSDPFAKEHERQQYAIGHCSNKFNCPLTEFIALIEKQEAKTGDWGNICNSYNFTDLTKEFPVKFANGKPPGKHSPKPGAIGPLAGLNADVDMGYRNTDKDAKPNPTYSKISVQPLGLCGNVKRTEGCKAKDKVPERLSHDELVEKLVAMSIGDEPWASSELYKEYILGTPNDLKQQEQKQQDKEGEDEAKTWENREADWLNSQKKGYGEELGKSGLEDWQQDEKLVETSPAPEGESSVLPAIIGLAGAAGLVAAAVNFSKRGRRAAYVNRWVPMGSASRRDDYSVLP